MSPVRAFELRGEQRAAALDWLHVHAELQGVLEEDERLVVWLEGALPQLPFAGVSVVERRVDPADALRTGLEHDVAILVAPDLLVRPPWVPRPSDFVGRELVVPRGDAFGSGEHGSTRATLLCLHHVWADPASLADVGTGSGILALYAHERGCPQVWGCDIDAASVRAARELLPLARFEHGGPQLLSPAESVVANMTGTELREAMTEILRLWRGPGPLVLGGMRPHEVLPTAALVGLPVVHRVEVEGFTSLCFLRGRAAP